MRPEIRARLHALWSHVPRRLQELILPHDPDEAPDLGEIRASRLRLRAIGWVLLLTLIWAALFNLDIASQSLGEVIPATHTKLVQHLEGGIVRKILVHEGQTVKAGQPLVELERVASQSDLGETQAQIGGLRIKALRLEAQLAGRAAINFPSELKSAFPEQVRNAHELLSSQSNRLSGGLLAQEKKVQQRNAEQAELTARKQHLTNKLSFLREQLGMNARLLKEGLSSQYEQLNLLKEEQTLVGSLAETEASMRRVSAAESQESATLRSQYSGDRETLQSDLENTHKQLHELQERLLKYSDSQKRLQVVAPIDGTVLRLHIVTEGGVVAPGGALLSLVPINDPLLIETQLPVGDVGLVKVGQPARIELVSSTARGFQPISGTVSYVSADRVSEQDKEPFYRVRIIPGQVSFMRGDANFPLMPGVRVNASIQIGQRSVLAYLIEPLRARTRGALSEP